MGSPRSGALYEAWSQAIWANAHGSLENAHRAYPLDEDLSNYQRSLIRTYETPY